MDEKLDILIKDAETQAKSFRGHAQELNAAASTQELLISALKDMKQQNTELRAQNNELYKENQKLKNNPPVLIKADTYIKNQTNNRCQLFEHVADSTFSTTATK